MSLFVGRKNPYYTEKNDLYSPEERTLCNEIKAFLKKGEIENAEKSLAHGVQHFIWNAPLAKVGSYSTDTTPYLDMVGRIQEARKKVFYK